STFNCGTPASEPDSGLNTPSTSSISSTTVSANSFSTSCSGPINSILIGSPMPTPSSISLTCISAPGTSCNSPSTFCTKSAVAIFLSSPGTSCIVKDASLSAAASPPCSTSSPPTLTKLTSLPSSY